MFFMTQIVMLHLLRLKIEIIKKIRCSLIDISERTKRSFYFSWILEILKYESINAVFT